MIVAFRSAKVASVLAGVYATFADSCRFMIVAFRSAKVASALAGVYATFAERKATIATFATFCNNAGHFNQCRLLSK
jgi:hypothetical protein